MPKSSFGFQLLYAISFAWQLGFLIVFPILGFAWIGNEIDKRTNPFHAFGSIGLGVGVVIAAYETYNLLEPLIKKKEDKK